MDAAEHKRADIEFHEHTAHAYEEVLGPIFAVYADLVTQPHLDALSTRAPGRRAIDIGCGTGSVTFELARRGFDVTGIDHSPAMLERAVTKMRDLGVDDKVELIEGDVTSLPFDGASFDVATCQGILHHLHDFEPCLSEITRILVPGGLLYIAEPCLGSTVALRLWDRGVRWFTGFRRTRASLERRFATAAVPEHSEGPISTIRLAETLHRLGYEADFQYWSRFAGLWKAPRWAQVLTLRLLSRPWLRRSGNLVVVRARRA